MAVAPGSSDVPQGRAKAEAKALDDLNVALAFSLGWQVAELYRPDPPGVAPDPSGG